MSTVPVPAGATAVIVLSPFAVNEVAETPPNITEVMAGEPGNPSRSAPVIVTLVPPLSGPFLGPTVEMVGLLDVPFNTPLLSNGVQAAGAVQYVPPLVPCWPGETKGPTNWTVKVCPLPSQGVEMTRVLF